MFKDFFKDVEMILIDGILGRAHGLVSVLVILLMPADKSVI